MLRDFLSLFVRSKKETIIEIVSSIYFNDIVIHIESVTVYQTNRFEKKLISQQYQLTESARNLLHLQGQEHLFRFESLPQAKKWISMYIELTHRDKQHTETTLSIVDHNPTKN